MKAQKTYIIGNVLRIAAQVNGIPDEGQGHRIWSSIDTKDSRQRISPSTEMW
jgi:hypothetical protein